ncbi:hypothetical protein F5141DRAFT_1069185 [Pisolithus sp. B1]|nr:hypothetical protein F5141DRAFT_1069185 [Pisolithus sp. B1]
MSGTTQAFCFVSIPPSSFFSAIMCLQRPRPSSTHKQLYDRTKSHSYGLRTRASRSSRFPTPVTSSPLASVSSSSASSWSLVSTAPTMPLSSPSTSESLSPLESGVRLTIEKVTEVTRLLDVGLKASRRERDEAKAELERCREIVDSRAAEVSALQALCDTVIQARDEAFKCGACELPCVRPFLLIDIRTQECRHLFCLSCLRQHFQECLHQQLKYREVPAHLGISKAPPYTAAMLSALISEEVLHLLLYHCPVCNSAVWERLKELHPLTQIIEALTGVLGAPSQTTEVGNMDGDIWAGVFPKSDDDWFEPDGIECLVFGGICTKLTAYATVIETGFKSLSDGNPLPTSNAVQGQAHIQVLQMYIVVMKLKSSLMDLLNTIKGDAQRDDGGAVHTSDLDGASSLTSDRTLIKSRMMLWPPRAGLMLKRESVDNRTVPTSCQPSIEQWRRSCMQDLKFCFADSLWLGFYLSSWRAESLSVHSTNDSQGILFCLVPAGRLFALQSYRHLFNPPPLLSAPNPFLIHNVSIGQSTKSTAAMPPENQSDSVPGAQSTKLPMNCARERSKSGPSLPHRKEGGHCCTSIAIVNVKGTNQFDAWILKNGLRWTAERGSLTPGAVDIAFTKGLPQEEVWENFWKNIKQADFLISHPISEFTPPGDFPIKKLALSPTSSILMLISGSSLRALEEWPCHGWRTRAQHPGDQSRCQHRAEQRSASAEVPEQAPSENQPGCFVEDNQLLGQDKALSQSVAQRRNLPEVKARVKARLYITSVLQHCLLAGV